MAADLPWADVDACTLPTVERPSRLSEIDSLLGEHLHGVTHHGATSMTLHLRDRPGLRDRVEDLTARESACCSFFTFTILEEGDGLALRIDVPEAHAEVLAALAGRAATLERGGAGS